MPASHFNRLMHRASLCKEAANQALQERAAYMQQILDGGTAAALIAKPRAEGNVIGIDWRTERPELATTRLLGDAFLTAAEVEADRHQRATRKQLQLLAQGDDECVIVHEGKDADVTLSSDDDTDDNKVALPPDARKWTGVTDHDLPPIEDGKVSSLLRCGAVCLVSQMRCTASTCGTLSCVTVANAEAPHSS